MRLLCDSFRSPAREGKVVDRTKAGSQSRSGIDVDRVFSIDNGALRIRPPLEAGWGRACLSYGPFKPCAGLAFGVFMLNGHNTAQSEPLPDTFRDRVSQWLVGSGAHRIRHRLRRLVAMRRLPRIWRQLRWWARLSACGVPRLDENLAVGWFTTAVSDPMLDGRSFVVHATGADNGELWVRQNGWVSVAGNVQNVPFYCVVVLRPRDVVYYVGGSVPAARGLPAYPRLRPVAIGSAFEPESVWASIHQSLLGQIGFRGDSRVYGAGVAQLEEWAQELGGAIGADHLCGEGELAGTEALGGERWTLAAGHLSRTERGVVAIGHGAATLSLSRPVGLLRGFLEGSGGTSGLWWRALDDRNRWEVVRSDEGFELAILENGERATVASEAVSFVEVAEIQVVDDGARFTLSCNGQVLFGRAFEDMRFAQATRIGIEVAGGRSGPSVRAVEAHPRDVILPQDLDFGSPWFQEGEQLLIEDGFEGDRSPLDGRVVPAGNLRWSRTFGEGRFETTGAGSVRVCASTSKPCPGRTLYTLDWPDRSFADVEVLITPPGKGRGQREHGSSGLVFWQDEDNYILVNTWLSDAYSGASISSFFHIGGWEDLYDAIWTNVGSQVRHGVPYRLRVRFDGLHYLVSVDGQSVLYRALTDVYADCRRLQIRRVGLAANWEWGNDTGTVFQQFHARA